MMKGIKVKGHNQEHHLIIYISGSNNIVSKLKIITKEIPGIQDLKDKKNYISISWNSYVYLPFHGFILLTDR